MIELTPCAAVQGTLAGIDPSRLTMELLDSHGRCVLRYQEHQPQELPLPEVAVTPLHAGAISSVDEAWFIGQHLEQYHHASRSPFDYYLRELSWIRRTTAAIWRWRCWNTTARITRKPSSMRAGHCRARIG
jgi:hypothetical protein